MSHDHIEKNKELNLWKQWSEWTASAVSSYVNLPTSNFKNDPFLLCLEAGVHSRYIKHFDKPDFKYDLSWAVAVPVVAGCYRPGFISTPNTRKMKDGKHAEIVLMEHYKRRLEDISQILISYSPCSKCTPKIITTFDDCRVKPSIKFHCIHGRSIEDGLKCIDELKAAGFSVGISDYEHYAKHLIDTAPTQDLRENFITSLEINEKALNTRKEFMERNMYERYAGLESM